MQDYTSIGPSITPSIMAHGAIALFGAVVHAARSHRQGTSKSIGDFLLLTVMSSFSGVMFALIALHMFPAQHYLTLAVAGTGGFLGVEGMTLVIEQVRVILTRKPQP